MQKTVSYLQPLGYRGTPATFSNMSLIRGAYKSMQNKSGGIIWYGAAVVYVNANKNSIKLPTASGQVVAGLAIFNDMSSGMSLENPDQQGYENNAYCSVYAGGPGDWWVYSETATDIGGPVFFRHTQVGQTKLGDFRQGADANFDAFPNATFTRKTSGAGLTTIQINGFIP